MSDLEPVTDTNSGGASSVPIEKIVPNPNQPRRTFNQPELEELSESIRQKGVIQPLIVRADPEKEGRFQIVAGERRWRAAQMAGLHQLPIVLREFSDQDVLEIGIIENVQREDLNPFDEALSYKQLMERFGHTQEQVSKALGKSRSYIANLVRLLGLPEDVQRLVRDSKLSAGHARALITSENPSALAAEVVARDLSVRETEKLVQGKVGPKASGSQAKKPQKDADTRALEGDLSAAIRMSVSIDHESGGEGGVVKIKYKDLSQLDDLCSKLTRS